MKKKTITISKLKAKLDKLFSLYIRRRFADHADNSQCVTCGKVDHWKNLQAGQFQSRRHHSIRWDLVNVQVQCVACNCFRNGEQYKFAIYLDNEYGKGTAKGLEDRTNELTKLSRIDYEEKIEWIKELLTDFD